MTIYPPASVENADWIACRIGNMDFVRGRTPEIIVVVDPSPVTEVEIDWILRVSWRPSGRIDVGYWIVLNVTV